MQILKWLDEHLEEYVLVLLLAIICVVELAQVIIRKIPFIPSLTWAEEFCRFMWIWSVFISLPYTIRKGSMLRVTVTLDLFPPVVRKLVNIIVDVLVLLSMIFCTWHSVGVVGGIIKSGETSPAMLWPMWLVYSFMLLGFAMASLRSLQQLYLHIKHFSGESKTTVEQTMEDAADEAMAGRIAEGGRA